MEPFFVQTIRLKLVVGYLLHSALMLVFVFLFQYTELQVILKELQTILDLLLTGLPRHKMVIWAKLFNVLAMSRQIHVDKQCLTAYISRVWPRP